MPRLGRRSAGEQVGARLSRLSDDLLDLEEACFDAIGAEFDVLVPDAIGLVDAAWRRAKDDPKRWASDNRLLDGVAGLHAAAMAETRGHVVGLSGQVRELALESIAEELTICEDTLGKKYQGLGIDAADAARVRSVDLVTERLERYEEALQAGQAAFAAQLKQQTLLVAQYGETPDQSVRRLFSREPLSMKGNGGRGIWWRASTGLNAAAREVSIRLSSTVRMAAMEEFNTLGARR